MTAEGIMVAIASDSTITIPRIAEVSGSSVRTVKRKKPYKALQAFGSVLYCLKPVYQLQNFRVTETGPGTGKAPRPWNKELILILRLQSNFFGM